MIYLTLPCAPSRLKEELLAQSVTTCFPRPFPADRELPAHRDDLAGL